MNPMADALRKKRMGSVNTEIPESDHSPAGPDQGDGKKDLLGMVASLEPHERSQLKNILDASDKNVLGVQKGEPTSSEHSKISEQINKDAATKSLEDTENDEHDDAMGSREDMSDDIGKSMLDSKFRNGPLDRKPANLGERVKQNIATQLKSKGKL